MANIPSSMANIPVRNLFVNGLRCALYCTLTVLVISLHPRRLKSFDVRVFTSHFNSWFFFTFTSNPFCCTDIAVSTLQVQPLGKLLPHLFYYYYYYYYYYYPATSIFSLLWHRYFHSCGILLLLLLFSLLCDIDIFTPATSIFSLLRHRYHHSSIFDTVGTQVHSACDETLLSCLHNTSED